MAIDITAVTLAELRYVVALADLRHFGRAARACNVTQPTLSAQVKKIETTLKTQIFERSPKSVLVTLLGVEIVLESRRVLDAMEKIADLASRGREPLSGPLRLGIIPTLGPYLLPWLVPALRSGFPRLSLVVREVKTSELVEEIARNQVDAGVLALPLPVSGLSSAPLFEEPFRLVTSTRHALAKKASIELGDLEDERVLLLDEGHCFRDQALAICQRAGANADSHGRESDFRATSIETLRHMVAAGMGSTLIPALALGERASERKKTVAIAFAAPQPVRRMALAWRRTHPRRDDFLELARIIRDHAPAVVKPIVDGRKPRR